MMTESFWYCVKAVSTAVSDDEGVSQSKLEHLAASIEQMGHHQRESLERDIRIIIQGMTELKGRLRSVAAE